MQHEQGRNPCGTASHQESAGDAGPEKTAKKPEWLRARYSCCPEVEQVRRILRSNGLHTVCESARCPNQAECWGAGTATVMIMGDVCTRGCRFCNVKTGHPECAPDPEEPGNVARAVADAGLKYVVLTSVDRDDLADGGAGHFAATIRAVKGLSPEIRVEALIPDYRGDRLTTVLESGVDVLAHNVEVVPRMTPTGCILSRPAHTVGGTGHAF